MPDIDQIGISPSVLGTLLPPKYNSRWLAAVAQQATKPAILGVLGASFEARTGTGTANVYSTNWFPVCVKLLLAKYGALRYGDSFVTSYNSSLGAGSAPNGHPITYDTAAATLLNIGPYIVGCWTVLNGGANPLIHYTHDSTDLGYNNLSGSFTIFDPVGAVGNLVWNLNGGINQNFALNGSGTIRKISWNSSTPGWINGNNIVNIVSQPAANTALIIEFSAYPGATGPGTSGIGAVWMANPSMCLHDLGRTDQNPALYAGAMATSGRIDKFAFLAGCQNTGAANPPYTPNTYGFPFNLNLLFVGVLDDWIFHDITTDNTLASVGGPQTTWTGGLAYDHHAAPPALFRNYLWRLRRAILSTNGDVFYTIGPIQSGFYSDVNTVGFPPQNFSAWRKQYIDSVWGDGCGMYDVSNDWGESGVAKGFQLAGDPHPIDAGDAYRAAVHASLM